MQISDAQALCAPAIPARSSLRAHFAQLYASSPQNGALVDEALALMEAGQAKLHAFGHHVEILLETGHAVELEESAQLHGDEQVEGGERNAGEVEQDTSSSGSGSRVPRSGSGEENGE